MKNKILSILLSIILLFACAFSMTLFASCSQTPPPGNEDQLPGDGDDNDGDNNDDDDDNQDDNEGDENLPEVPGGELPPLGDSDWGVGEMPIQ